MVDLRSSLKEVTLEGVKETDLEIGRGSYGVVKEYTYQGMRCAGKTIHEVLAGADSEQKTAVMVSFEAESNLLSRQRHPNIVLFLGVFFKHNEDLPSLLMELLPMSLDIAIASIPNIRSYYKEVILLDVARGLSYLHARSDPIIHRDLSPKNVLLTESFRAKIADLGVSRMISKFVDKTRKLTKMPGTPGFMPPEANQDHPEYNTSLDMFSFGNLVLCTVNQKWPELSSREANGTIVKEVQRRATAIEEMDKAHPDQSHQLRIFTESCLSDAPNERPKASDAVDLLSERVRNCRPRFSNALQMVQHIDQLENEKTCLRQENAQHLKEKDNLEREVNSERDKNNGLTQQVTALRKELTAITAMLKKSDGDESLNKELLSCKDERIEGLEMELEAMKCGPGNQAIGLLDPTRVLQWKKCSPLPHPLKHMQAIELNDKIYVGSGYAPTKGVSYLVHCYIPATDKWEEEEPLKSQTRQFAMASFNDTLLLIGGTKQDGSITSEIQYLCQDGREIKFYSDDIMPRMPTARAGAVATSLAFNLIVAGGYDSSGNRLSTVEVYDSRSKLWSKTASLPEKCAEMKTAVVHGDLWYLLGGSNQYQSVFSASMKEIINSGTSSVSKDEASGAGPTSSEVWEKLADVPHEFSCVSFFGGNLISIGGTYLRLLRTTTAFSKNICVYDSNKKNWICVAELPIPLSRSTAVTLANGDLLLMGGRNGDGSELNTVFKC